MARGTFSSSQAAEKLHVHPETLRRWETEGLVSPQRTKGGHRRYSTADINRLRNKQSPDSCPHCQRRLNERPWQTGERVMIRAEAIEPDTTDLRDNVGRVVELGDYDRGKQSLVISFGKDIDLIVYGEDELVRLD